MTQHTAKSNPCAMTFVRLQNISYRRESHTLFQRVSLTLDTGDCVIVRGANGSGKSTLLRLAYGLLPMQKGRRTPPMRAPRAIFLAHEDALTPALSVEHNLNHRSDLWNLPRTAAHNCITQCQLHSWRHTPIDRLSAGQRQKVAIASLTMTPPQTLWILDEPEQHLDQHHTQWLYQLLSTHCAAGGAVLMASHHDGMIVPDATALHL